MVAVVWEIHIAIANTHKTSKVLKKVKDIMEMEIEIEMVRR